LRRLPEGSRSDRIFAKCRRAVEDPDGGTAYILYRKDRIECSKGAELLKRYKVKETSTTNRCRCVLQFGGVRELRSRPALGFGISSAVSRRTPASRAPDLHALQAKWRRAS
jgi:hypothetical protein